MTRPLSGGSQMKSSAGRLQESARPLQTGRDETILSVRTPKMAE
jgi:hypothetical protein